MDKAALVKTIRRESIEQLETERSQFYAHLEEAYCLIDKTHSLRQEYSELLSTSREFLAVAHAGLFKARECYAQLDRVIIGKIER